MGNKFGNVQIGSNNPFTPDFGTLPKHQVGHDELIHELSEGFATGPSDRRFTSLLLGPRGSGKTVILKTIRDVAVQEGWMVLPVDSTTPNLIERIDDAINDLHETDDRMPAENADRRTSRKSSSVKLGPMRWQREAIKETKTTWSTRKRLQVLSEHAEQRDAGVMLAIDEIHSGNRNELRRLAADIQHITKSEQLPLALLAAGLSELHHTLLEDDKLTFFQRCSRFDMPLLSVGDVEQCLTATIHDANGEIHDDALAVLLKAAGRLPFRLQLLGHHAWRIGGAPTKRIDEDAAVLAVEATNHDMHRLVFLPTWNNLNESEQTYLSVLARFGGKSTQREISGASGLPVSTRARVEQHLIDSGCIERQPNHVIGIGSLISVEDILALETQQGHSIPGQRALPLSDKQDCGALMPRAKARCVLAQGHRGRHRSR